MGTKILFLIVAGSVFSNGLFAAEEEEKPKVVSRAVLSETVTVTAEADLVEIEKTPNPVIVISTEKIEKSGTNTLSRLLELAFPGRISGYGGFGTSTSLFINGARSTDSVVLLDGIRVSNTAPGGVDFSNFMLTGVDRVEILPVPSSTLYGADAHGGVVSMSTRGPGGRGLSGYALGQGSSIGQMRAGALASYAKDNWWVQGGGDTEESPQAIKAINPYRAASGYIGFGHFSDNSLFTVSHRSSYKGAPTPFNWDSDYSNWPVVSSVRRATPDREYLVWQSITTASFKSYLSDSVYTEFNFGNVSYQSVQDAYSGSEESSPYNAYKPGFDQYQGNARVAWKGDKSSVTVLGDVIKQDYNAISAWGNSAFKAQNSALVLEGSIEPVSVLRLVGSVRQQFDTVENILDWGAPIQGPDGNDISISVDTLTWKAGANLLLPSGFRAYASAGTSFNTPSLSSLAYNQLNNKPMPGNDSSTSILAGVGFEKNNQWVRVDASQIYYDKLVTYRGTGEEGYYVNDSDIQVHGVELAVGQRRSNWDAEIFARSQEGRQFKVAGSGPDAGKLVDVPKEDQLKWFQVRPFFSAGVRANYVLDNMNFGINLSYMGHRYSYSEDFGSGYADQTQYIDCTLRFGMQWNKNLTTTLYAERLFQDGISLTDWELGKDLGQDNMSNRIGYPSHGRAINLEVRYKF